MEDRIEEKSIIEIEKAKPAVVAPASLFDFGSNLDRAWKFADVLSKSAIIPDTFKGNTASCLIALDMANRMKRNPLEIMQSLYIVHGKPSFSSSFLIALINSCGYYEPLRFKFNGEGDSRSCQAWTMDKRTGERLEGPEISIKLSKEEGWYGKNGSKWKTMPEVMLRYRAAAFFSRAYCPDLTGGFHTAEEIQEGSDLITSKTSASQDLRSELMSLSKPKQHTPPLPEPSGFPLPEAEPVPTGPATVTNGAFTEVEKLREKAKEMLLVHMGLTEIEADEWCLKNFGRKRSELSKRELETTIAKCNAELDARDGVNSPNQF